MSARGFGDAVANSFGLNDSPTVAIRSLRKSQVAVSRLSIGPAQLGMSARIPAEDTFILALYLSGVRHHELWRSGRRAITQGYATKSMRIVNLIEEYSANIVCPHELMAFYIPRAALDEFCHEHGLPRVSHLRCEPGHSDPIVSQLAELLLPALESPGQASALFVDHIMLALCAHLAGSYGESRSQEGASRGLTPAELLRATEYMASQSQHDVQLADVARQCGLSRGYFAQRFKLAAGLSPHQWLQRYRIEKAQNFLATSKDSVAEIATSCGFADQSHLTRVFSRLAGDTPAAWRRRCHE